MLAILRNGNFRWLWTGQLVSRLGDEIRNWTLIFWVFNASGQSPLMQALSFIATSAPMLFVGPLAGVLVDRWDRRKVMIMSDVLRGVLALAMVAAVASGQLYAALLLVFLGSCVAQFFTPARGAMVPLMVGRDQLLQANSLSQTTNSLLMLAGPALGTLTYTYLGATTALTANAIAFFLSGVCIAMISISGAVAKTGVQQAVGAEFMKGLRFVGGSTALRALFISFSVLAMGAGAINSLMIFLVRGSLGLSESAMSYFATAMPAAMLLSALVLGSSARKLKRPPLLVPIAMLLATTGIGVIAGAPNLWVMIGGFMLVGVCNALLQIGVQSIVQSSVPNQMMGRVLGLLNMAPQAAMLISAALAGAAAEWVDVRMIMWVAVVPMFAATVLAYSGLREVTLPGREQVPVPAAD